MAVTAQEQRSAGTARLSSLTGVLFPVAFIATGVLIGGAAEQIEGQPAEATMNALVDNGGRVMAGGVTGMIGAAALLWFAGALRAHLRSLEAGPGRLSAIAFGGGVAAASIMTAGIAIGLSATFDLADFLENADATVAAFSIAGGLMFLGVGWGLGVMVLASSIAAKRSGALPGWLAMLGIIVGAVQVLGSAFWPVLMLGGLLSMIWIVVTSIVLFRKSATG